MMMMMMMMMTTTTTMMTTMMVVMIVTYHKDNVSHVVLGDGDGLGLCVLHDGGWGVGLVGPLTLLEHVAYASRCHGARAEQKWTRKV
jgi:hypothetical protein